MNYPLLHQAIRFAVKAHKGQDRDEAEPLPYVTHPIDVVNLLRYEGGVVDEAILCAAALHDVLEETCVTQAEIERRFGPEVRGHVEQLTREEPTKEQRVGLSEREVWELRSAMLLAEIQAMPPEIQQVKLADRISNLSMVLATRQGERRERYLRQSRQFLAVIPRAANPALWDRLHGLLEAEERRG